MMFLLTILAIIVVLYIVETKSIKNSLKGIEYFQKPSLLVVEPDEKFDIICTLENKTMRFVSYLRLKEKFSKGVKLSRKTEDTDYDYLETSQYLMPKQALERWIPVSIPNRGIYYLFGALIYGGDFLGINETMGKFENIEEIIVIPKETIVSDVEIKLSGYIGEMSINRFIFEDPILTVGFNDYTGQEPLKMISWVQTARTGNLMVKKYDYTLELMVNVILNIDHNISVNYEIIEECFSMGRSVCQFLESRNVKYRVITNAITAGTKPIFENLDYFGWGRSHLMTILEGLGRASNNIVRESLDKMLKRAINSAEIGIGNILITPKLEDRNFRSKEDKIESEAKLLSMLNKLKELTGHDVCVINPNLTIDLILAQGGN